MFFHVGTHLYLSETFDSFFATFVSFAGLAKFADVIDQSSQSTGLVSLDLTMVNLVVYIA